MSETRTGESAELRSEIGNVILPKAERIVPKWSSSGVQRMAPLITTICACGFGLGRGCDSTGRGGVKKTAGEEQ